MKVTPHQLEGWGSRVATRAILSEWREVRISDGALDQFLQHVALSTADSSQEWSCPHFICPSFRALCSSMTFPVRSLGPIQPLHPVNLIQQIHGSGAA